MAGGLTDYLKRKLLDRIFSDAAYSIPATLYVGLVTDTNTQAQRHAGTVTEVTGTAYARVAVTNNNTNWPAASGSTTASKANGTAITWAISLATWGTVTGFIVADASSGTNILAWGDLLAAEKAVQSVDISTDLLQCPGHGYAAGDKLKFSSIAGVAVPAGLTDGAYYFVIASGLVTDAFKVSATSGGSAINITAIGGGKVGLSQELAVGVGITVNLPVGALVLTAL